MAKLTDPKINGRYPFQYRNSSQTDLAATFARLRKEQRKAKPTVCAYTHDFRDYPQRDRPDHDMTPWGTPLKPGT